MTEDEKRQQKAMLLLEYQEEEDNIAHLKEKARRKAAQFQEIQNWLSWVASVMKPYDAEERKRDATIRANIDSFRPAINFEEALALVDEVIAAEKALGMLRNRKAELGLK
jgi:hypothetical protein